MKYGAVLCTIPKRLLLRIFNGLTIAMTSCVPNWVNMTLHSKFAINYEKFRLLNYREFSVTTEVNARYFFSLIIS